MVSSGFVASRSLTRCRKSEAGVDSPKLMPTETPSVVLLAGPNGAGKSTSALAVLESIRKRLPVFSELRCYSVIELLRCSWTELSDHEVDVADLNHRRA